LATLGFRATGSSGLGVVVTQAESRSTRARQGRERMATSFHQARKLGSRGQGVLGTRCSMLRRSFMSEPDLSSFIWSVADLLRGD
jgi:hypothetical protein